MDIRYIVTSNQPLREWAKTGRFRKDLYHRLDGITLELPDLRDRRQDIPMWAEQFLQRFSLESGRILSLTPSAIERLMEYDWPGNLRQLDKVIRRAVTFCTGNDVGPDELMLDGPSDLYTTEEPPDTPATAPAGDPLNALRSLPGEFLEDKLQIAYGMLLAHGVPRRNG